MTLSKPPFFPIGKLHMHSMDLKPMTIPCKEEVIFELELTGAHQVKPNVISFFSTLKSLQQAKGRENGFTLTMKIQIKYQ